MSTLTCALDVGWPEEYPGMPHERSRATSFLRTGCPNPNPITLGYWQTLSATAAFAEMYRYCNLNANGQADTAQSDVCCGTGQTCTPTCIQQIANLMDTQTTPCDVAAWRVATLATGDGYYYDPLHDGAGWCRKIDAANVATIRTAYANGDWAPTCADVLSTSATTATAKGFGMCKCAIGSTCALSSGKSRCNINSMDDCVDSVMGTTQPWSNHACAAAGATCGERITWAKDNMAKTDTQARALVGAEFPVECGACNTLLLLLLWLKFSAFHNACIVLLALL